MAKSNASNNISYEELMERSEKFKDLKRQCKLSVRLSLTGITNLVVNHEDPHLVDVFIKECYNNTELYKETYEIDAVELQRGNPGRGQAAAYLETLIFGSVEEEDSGQGVGVAVPKVNPQTGKRERRPDGFVNRKEVFIGDFKDRLLIIKNLDYCLDFCGQDPGVVDQRNLWIFDNFRNPSVRMGCRILLISNVPLKFPFKTRSVCLDPLDPHEASHIVSSFVQLYSKAGYVFDMNDGQKKQIVRKLNGLTYTQAADILGEALSCNSSVDVNPKRVVIKNIIKNLREKVNRSLMDDASGLTHLSAKPWADYICPNSSNFTFDVKKIVRDFEEINRLKEEEKKLKDGSKKSDSISQTTDAIRARMPHVIILYGRGGVGKSAFPIHFGGLLDLDVWDFNIGACHSKWVGEGAERMREALNRINKASHLVVRVDEYDRAIGSTEGSGQGMHSAHKQVESEFMNWLQNAQEDNLFAKNDIFLVLTTNHKENITGPLLRSGRADLVIDINAFDDHSVRETFLSCARRMKNRGLLPPVGFDTFDKFQDAINSIELDKLLSLCSQNGFTVRDIDIFLVEMASHAYYKKIGKGGLEWNTDNFVKVMEKSIGSAKDSNTNELSLGDRFIMENSAKETSPQIEFGFVEDYNIKDPIDIEVFD